MRSDHARYGASQEAIGKDLGSLLAGCVGYESLSNRACKAIARVPSSATAPRTGLDASSARTPPPRDRPRKGTTGRRDALACSVIVCMTVIKGRAFVGTSRATRTDEGPLDDRGAPGVRLPAEASDGSTLAVIRER